MSRNIYQLYEEGTAKERAELIYSNFDSFAGILEDYKARLIYKIQAEEQFWRCHNRDELGVRIQNLGNYDDPTAQEVLDRISLEKSFEGTEQIELSDQIGSERKRILRRKHHVLIIMGEEYCLFDKHLRTLRLTDQNLIIPYLRRTKDYCQMAEENRVSEGSIRQRIYRIHKLLIEDMTGYFIEKI